MDNSGNRALGDHRVIQADIMENNLPIPLNNHIQHHPVVNSVLSGGKEPQFLQLRTLQLGHESHGADVYSQKRQASLGSGFGHMENGSITAKTDNQIRIPQFPVQSGKMDVFGQIIAVFHFKGKANLNLKPRILQNLHGAAECMKIFIPVWIGGKYQIFHPFTP